MPKPIDIRGAARKVLHREKGTAAAQEHYVKHLAHDEGFKLIPRALITPDPDQPRKHFDRQSLEELAASIKEKGILQTLIVRPDPATTGSFVLVAGERRWRAAGLIELEELPCIIRTNPDPEEVAIIENVQRENLTPLELAAALERLKVRNGYTDAQLAKVIGKSRQTVSETLSLNDLPADVKAEAQMPNVRQPSKLQLLQVLRAGNHEKVRAAWDGLKAGEVSTVRELRERNRKPAPGRPKQARLEYVAKGNAFRLTLTFKRKTIARADVRHALKAALKELPKQLHA